MGKEIVRVLRILEYVGERDWVEETLKNGSVPANGQSPKWGNGINIVKSAIIDQFPEALEIKEEENIENDKENEPDVLFD